MSVSAELSGVHHDWSAEHDADGRKKLVPVGFGTEFVLHGNISHKIKWWRYALELMHVSHDVDTG